MTRHLFTLFTIGLLTFSTTTSAAQHSHATLKERGAAAMGFDQDAAEHHFLLFADGGAIEVRAIRRGDTGTRSAVRSHLQTIAREFANGVFDQPFATHAEMPAGVPTLQQFRAALTYAYEDSPDGGRVRITASDPNALAGVHEFLRYQIVEHKTGDPLSPRKR